MTTDTATEDTKVKKTPVKKKNGPFVTGVLSYARSVQVSEGLMTAVQSSLLNTPFSDDAALDGSSPISIQEKGVRGQTSSYAAPGSAAAKKAANSNIQTVEAAYIPPGSDALLLSFSIRVSPASMSPQAANDPEVAMMHQRLAEAYAGAGGYRTLAALYVWNIANGRFAWRNRFQADDAVVSVVFDDREIRFDPFILSLSEVADEDEMAAALVMGNAEDLGDFVSLFAEGLASKTMNFKLSWIASMPAGSEVFPSQEYVREEKVSKDVSRVLASLPAMQGGKQIRQASMHSQKCNAALRHIDIWHGNDDHGAVAVNAYAGVQDTGEVLRPAKGNNFWKIRDAMTAETIDALTLASSPEDISDDVHFVMSNLVRGGVYGRGE